MPHKKRAIIMVDLQNDFCTGGSLAVPDGEAVIPIANRLQDLFDYVVVTKDWHPANHMSFAANHPGKQVGSVISVHNIDQVLWPVHCVQHTRGAELHPELALHRIDHLVHKGTQPAIDSYSAFFDNEHLRSTGLADYLHSKNIHDVFIMGLATDYCVKYSCLDAVHLGFNTYIILDACRGVELRPGDVAKTIELLHDRGVVVTDSKAILLGNLL